MRSIGVSINEEGPKLNFSINWVPNLEYNISDVTLEDHMAHKSPPLWKGFETDTSSMPWTTKRREDLDAWSLTELSMRIEFILAFPEDARKPRSEW